MVAVVVVLVVGAVVTSTNRSTLEPRGLLVVVLADRESVLAGWAGNHSNRP